jgi:hypothetical protein
VPREVQLFKTPSQSDIQHPMLTKIKSCSASKSRCSLRSQPPRAPCDVSVFSYLDRHRGVTTHKHHVDVERRREADHCRPLSKIRLWCKLRRVCAQPVRTLTVLRLSQNCHCTLTSTIMTPPPHGTASSTRELQKQRTKTSLSAVAKGSICAYNSHVVVGVKTTWLFLSRTAVGGFYGLRDLDMFCWDMCLESYRIMDHAVV